MMADLLPYAQCAPAVHPDTVHRLVQVESGAHPYAIGVVGARLAQQPRTQAQAVASALWLEQHGYNYSLGLLQINRSNLARYGLTLSDAFDVCSNLRAGATILARCYQRARAAGRPSQLALRDAFSCYESGNFHTGYRDGYVQKIVAIPALPATATTGDAAAPGNTPQRHISLHSPPLERYGQRTAPAQPSALAF